MKNPEMEKVLDEISKALFGRSRKSNQCVSCGKPVDIARDFRDLLSAKEFALSRMCQECQDSVFG